MPLDRHRQVAQLWDWLPAFRAAAEYESLQRAALALSVSPSALSRSIKKLEESLGHHLFTRSPTGLTLTEPGHRLLDATREAMRRVHDALPGDPHHEVRTAAVGAALEHLLFDALLEQPPLRAHQGLVAALDFEERLRCGEVDFVLAHDVEDARGLSVTALPSLPLVLASATGERSEVAAVDAPGLRWPGATLHTQGLERLVSLGARSGLTVHLPRCLVPSGWTVHEVTSALPVIAVRRKDLGAPAERLTRLERAVTQRLESR